MAIPWYQRPNKALVLPVSLLQPQIWLCLHNVGHLGHGAHKLPRSAHILHRRQYLFSHNSCCNLRPLVFAQTRCLTITLPPERTQPQKLCTANFSSGTLKTLNRLLRLKNKIFWRAPCEKKPFFSRLKSDSQKYILKWSYWPEILAPGLKSIFVTTLFSNFFHFTQPLPSWQPPLKWGKGGIFALLA